MIRLNRIKTGLILFLVVIFCNLIADTGEVSSNTWIVVDTGQNSCYNSSSQITTPQPGEPFYGQDAQYTGTQPLYTDNGDGTITDNNTGLMWQKDPGEKTYWAQAIANASSCRLAGYGDWRVPTIKELYSLINFNGVTGTSSADSIPYIDTDYFVFNYGDPSDGDRFIDSQFVTCTEYVSTTMGGNPTFFGVNFADGRIKGYPQENKLYYIHYVRGKTDYGKNNFINNGDGTITDQSTGLMWMQNDSGHLGAGVNNNGGLNWQQALEWAENLEYAGYSDWRLPNAKELQGIVDYTRSPETTHSAAIDPVFNTSSIIDAYGQVNYPYFWTGTTHLDGMSQAATAVYIAFGEAQGWMQDPQGNYTLMDVHGAGAQRSDPKSGNPDDFPYGRGPQGDVITIYNHVRCVRDTGSTPVQTTYTLTVQSSPENGIEVGVSPADNNSNTDGTTTFNRTYEAGATVTLTAPQVYNGRAFNKWTINGTDSTDTSVPITMNTDTTAIVYYTTENSGTPTISLSRSRLNFGILKGQFRTRPQHIYIGNSGSGTLSWTASANVSWLTISPTSWTGNHQVTVSLNEDSAALNSGVHMGTITVTDGSASNSPQRITVKLRVFRTGNHPFGNFETPQNGSIVRSSIVVSGWALDDIAVERVMIYYSSSGTIEGNLIYIGDAVLVDGARPDVELNFPDYPLNNQGGWGYMLLTNFLPNGGNGTFTLVAQILDTEGNISTLGSKTIQCDNHSAVKPFGAIDTPMQGGIASGNNFANYGWVLTPRPNYIPTDGSTISVYIDGVSIGHPTYNLSRNDIASLFPGYTNSNGALGYFRLDTTVYKNGVHSIAWVARDSAGNVDGIGSRYFTIQNEDKNSNSNGSGSTSLPVSFLNGIVERTNGYTVKYGFDPTVEAMKPEMDNNGNSMIVIKPTDRIEIYFSNAKEIVETQTINTVPTIDEKIIQGFLKVGNQLQSLPVGATLNQKSNTFCWQPGPGFLGNFDLVFLVESGTGEQFQVPVSISISSY